MGEGITEKEERGRGGRGDGGERRCGRGIEKEGERKWKESERIEGGERENRRGDRGKREGGERERRRRGEMVKSRKKREL